MCASSGKCGESERAAPSTTQPKTALLARLVDAHCHPTDSAAYAGPPTSIEEVHLLKILAMSTRLDDQQATVDLHEAFPAKVIPCFGLHPWFAHQISLAPASSLPSKEYHYATLFPVCPEHPDELHPALEALLPSLPSPVSILDFLNQLERHLIAYPSALLGEVGIDRAFRIPNQPGSVEAKQNALSPLATPLPHQLAVVVAQIEVAIRLRRSISFHSVRSAQETVALLARLKKKDGFERIHLCLHSFGGKPESINQIQKGARSLSFPPHPNVYFSFATLISGRSRKFGDLLRSVHPDRLLLESDYHSLDGLDRQVWEAFEAVCEARGWSQEECVSILEANWSRFVEEEPEQLSKPKRPSKAEKREERSQRGGLD